MNNKFPILFILVSLLIVSCEGDRGDRGVMGLTGPTSPTSPQSTAGTNNYPPTGEAAVGHHYDKGTHGNAVECLNGFHITILDNFCRDSEGYSIYGLDQNGLGRDGYDTHGRDVHGYDRQGLDRFGCDVHHTWDAATNKCHRNP